MNDNIKRPWIILHENHLVDNLKREIKIVPAVTWFWGTEKDAKEHLKQNFKYGFLVEVKNVTEID